MATNERLMPVPPEALWDALADAGNYGYWVVGSKLIRDADADWPAPGSRFHHTIGLGPFTVNDHTVALDAEPGRLLKLRAKAGPRISAIVTLELIARPGGTLVRMREDPERGFLAFALLPLLHVGIKLRNAESLARLERVALRYAREMAA